MGNTPPEQAGTSTPPRYEETPVDLIRLRIDAGCPCHNRYAVLRATIEEFAQRSLFGATTPPTTYQLTKYCRLTSLLGIIWGSTNDCASTAGLCDEDHEPCAVGIKLLGAEIDMMGPVEGRSAADERRWLRHVADVRFLSVMVGMRSRGCKNGEGDVGEAGWRADGPDPGVDDGLDLWLSEMDERVITGVVEVEILSFVEVYPWFLAEVSV